jgi:hypothetical protein
MFDCGCSYQTKTGKWVQIVKARDIGGPYHVVMGKDGIWRYARPGDAGRVTGSNFDMSHPANLVVPNAKVNGGAAAEPQNGDKQNG